MKSKEQEYIEAKSKSYENECSCTKCQNMCRRAVCLGTPQDILNLINNGHIHRLRMTENRAFVQYGFDTYEMIQPEYDDEKGACTFFNNGLCELHNAGLKPTEGKLADCKRTHFNAEELPTALVVSKMWRYIPNIPIIEKIALAFSKAHL